MEFNERLAEELSIIENREYTPASMLSERFGVSDRTIRSDIAAINSTRSPERRVLLKRKHGYYLSAKEESEGPAETSVTVDRAEELALTTKEEIPLDSKNQRKRFVLRLLLFNEEPVSFAELASVAYIAEDTVKTYMSSIRSTLKQYGLNCIAHRNDGILVYGPEEGRRECFLEQCIDRERISYVTDFDAMERDACAGVDLEAVRDMVGTALAQAHLVASDRGFKDLVLDVGLAAARVQARHLVEPTETHLTVATALLAANQICRGLSKRKDEPIDEGERTYIYSKILKHTNAQASEVDSEVLRRDIEALLNIAYAQYSIDLRQDDVLKENLFKHLSLIFSGEVESLGKNTLLKTIKQAYPLPYDIALASTERVFNKPPYVLNEAEAGYIALHIGAAMGRNRSIQEKPCDIALVCSEGRSVQQIFASRVTALFGNSVRVTANVSYQEFTRLSPQSVHADLILSTVPLEAETLTVPYLFVSWNLPTHDIQAVSRAITESRNRWNDVADRFFDKSSFLYVNGKADRDRLLQRMCDALVSNGIAQDDLYEQVNSRERISDTAITDLLAIPHPLVPSTNQTRISVAILSQSLAWSQEHNQVRIVLLLAIKPSNTDSIEDLYDLLTQIISNEELQKRLLHVTTYEEFVKLIREYYAPSWNSGN